MRNLQDRLPHTNIFAILLIVAILAAQLSGLLAGTRAQPAPAQQTVMIKSLSPCSQSKSAQHQSGSLCRDIVKNTAITSEATFFIDTLTGKLYFLILASILTLGFRQRLYKPPKYLCV